MAKLSNEAIVVLLHSKLKRVQRDMFQSFLSNEKSIKFVIHCARRLGKTYLLCILALIFAFKKPDSQIRYASVTQKAVRKMIHPIIKQIQADIPVSQRGKWNTQEGAYIFPNGSMIHVAGVNNGKSDDLRGTAADLAIVDEAAFIDELTYLIDSVLMPQLITTGGQLVMASSSPLSPSHEFADYIAEAIQNESYAAFDIYQGDYPEDKVAAFCKESGGVHSITWRREYLNELIVDDTLSIIPEWKDDYIQEVEKSPLHKFYHKYVSMDVGVRDQTAVLFGYYDFKEQKLVIEDEFCISGPDTTTRNISTHVKAFEKELGWSGAYRRIADNNNLILLQDLGTEYDLHFAATNKDSLAAMISEVRLMVQDGRILIHPKCKQLIGALKFGVFYDSTRKEFGRSKTYGHYDALASLTYLVRNLDLHTNPIPPTHGISPQSHWIPAQNHASEQAVELRKLFKT